MPFNTRNPIPSGDLRDLDDNARNIDTWANDRTKLSHPDRFGVPRKTYYGIEQDAQAVLDSAEAIRDNLGFFPPVDYTSGLTVDSRNFTVTYNGVVYAAQPSAVTFTTGAWDAQQWYPLQNIYSDHNLLVFESFAEASAAAATLPDGQVIFVRDSSGRASEFKVMGGNLQYVGLLPDAVQLLDYSALRQYDGKSLFVDITASGIAGRFHCVGNSTQDDVDDGFLKIIDAEGRTWVRVVSGENEFKVSWAEKKTGEDDTPRLNRIVKALEYLDVSFVLEFNPANYVISDEVDFTNINKKFVLRGARDVVNIRPTPFGASKACFRLPENTAYDADGFTFVGGSANKNHPIGFYAPGISGTRLRNVRGSQLGNTLIWGSRPFNSDWDNIDVMFCGYQPLQKSVTSTLRASINSGSDIIQTNEPVFDAGDVGKIIYIPITSISNNGCTAVISEVISATQARMDRQMLYSEPEVKISFGAITGSITASSTTLTVEKPCFDADDLGRFLYIDKAGNAGGTLITKVAEVISSTSVRLANSASKTVTNVPVYFTPGVVLSGYEQPGSTPINDLVISNLQVEGYRGPGLVVSGGTHLFFNNLKTHGHAYSSTNFGFAGPAILWSGTTRGRINGYELEFGCPALNDGVIVINGNTPRLQIDGLTLNALCYGEYLISFKPETASTSSLTLGTINGNEARYNEYKDLISCDNNDQRLRVFGTGAVLGAGRAQEYSHQLQSMFGSVRAIPPTFISSGQTLTFTPATRVGRISVIAADTFSYSGDFFFRTVNNATAKVFGPETVTATKNNAGSLNVFCEDNKLCVQNNSAGARTFHIAIMG